jgi:acyl dehydratase
MTLLNDEILSYVGKTSVKELACDPVESGAVRRYSQAIMDDDPIYWDPAAAGGRYDGPVAPPIFPIDMFRRPFNTPDPVQIYATDPDFDGVGPPSGQGLPAIEPLRNFAVLYGGSEIEFYKYAKLGDRVSVVQRYASITEKESSKGPMLLVNIESEYRDQNEEMLVRLSMTTIWRQPT